MTESRFDPEDEAFKEIERNQEKIKYRDAFPKDYDLPTYFTGKHAVSMTLRDYFAAKAMQAIIQDTGINIGEGKDKSDKHDAEAAYRYADAMLKAREA